MDFKGNIQSQILAWGMLDFEPQPARSPPEATVHAVGVYAGFETKFGVKMDGELCSCTWIWENSTQQLWQRLGFIFKHTFFGFYQALNPHFFTLAVHIKDIWPFLTFHSIHPEKNHQTIKMLKVFGCSGIPLEGKIPRYGRTQHLHPTIPGENVSVWVFGGHGYSRLLFQPPDIGPSHWIYLHPPPGTAWCVRSQPFGKIAACSHYFLKKQSLPRGKTRLNSSLSWPELFLEDKPSSSFPDGFRNTLGCV